MLHKEEKVLKKTVFLYELKGERDMHSENDLVMCFVSFNRHVGRHIYGFDWIHGGYGVCRRKFKESYYIFAWRKNYVCQIHSLRERKR